MCLIFLALNAHPNYKLIVAANRDEFYKRKTAPAQFWEDHQEILGGRDLEAMGTWMGMNRAGKIAMVTNYRDPKNINPKAPSRGQLVSDFLIGIDSPEAYLRKLEPEGNKYNGFNLLVGDTNEMDYYSNYDTGILRLTDGIHGLSNHLMDTPWPKVTRVKNKFEKLLKAEKPDAALLLDALYDEQRADQNELPDTGVGRDWEEVLSSMFIKASGYGTRCSTVVLMSRDDQVTFVERVYDPVDFTSQTRSFEFQAR